MRKLVVGVALAMVTSLTPPAQAAPPVVHAPITRTQVECVDGCVIICLILILIFYPDGDIPGVWDCPPYGN